MHVDRLVNADDFIRRCKDLNVEVSLGELEHYEKIGAMLPVARVVYPDEYVVREDQCERDGETDWGWLAEWPSVLSLQERDPIFPFDYDRLPDECLVHWFDRAVDAGDNPHLRLPTAGDFIPWSEYRVTVDDGYGSDLERSTVKHYYSCWQVHQLYSIQRFPDLYRNAWLIGFIPDDHPLKGLHPWFPPAERLADFEGKRDCFNALSFWATVYRRERDRTFAGVPPGVPPVVTVRRLDGDQAAEHQGRLVDWANTTLERFGLTVQDLYRFLRELVELHEEYEDAERYKLAGALTQDIFACEHLLDLITGEDREQVSDRLGFHKQTFRHLSPVTKERDYALDNLNILVSGCRQALEGFGCSDWSFTGTDAAALLDYCQKQGLGLMTTALSGLLAVGYEEYRQKSRRVLQYTNLKNVLTSYEYLLKNLAGVAHPSVGGETLTQAVHRVTKTENWFGLFVGGQRDLNGNSLLRGSSARKLLGNLDVVLSDGTLKGSADGYWARAFLITCLARNMAVHFYPSDDRYYGDLFGPMLDAVTVAMFYTWKMADKMGWVQST